MPQIIPITELRNTSEILERCHSTSEPIFITKNGFGDLVIMSMETYDSIMETLVVDKAILASEQRLSKGEKPIGAREAFKRLDNKYGL
ncbi:prevent-host-death family protein [Lachnospiraceae bacterium NE2001]|nr:prevent-host-death family protein [Lachnospiraceae bacterium NE2001]